MSPCVMTEEQTELAHARARALAYDVLAAGFVYPEQFAFEMLKSSEFESFLQVAVTSLGYDRELADSLNRLRIAGHDLGLTEWQSDYNGIFGHSIAGDCPPYETHYGNAHVFMQSQELADIAAFYRAFGLEIAEGTERVDHLAAELEFMSFLFFKEAHALQEEHDDEKIAIVRGAQRRFLNGHLGRWVPPFCRLLRKSAASAFYRELAAFTLGFIERETTALGAETHAWTEADLRAFGEDLDPDCLSCLAAPS